MKCQRCLGTKLPLRAQFRVELEIETAARSDFRVDGYGFTIPDGDCDSKLKIW